MATAPRTDVGPKKSTPYVTSATVFMSLGFLVVVGAFVIYTSPTWALGAAIKKGKSHKQKNSIRRTAGSKERPDEGARRDESSSWISVLNDWGLNFGLGAMTDDGSFDELGMWYGEELAGYGPFNCSAQDITDQQQDWVSSTHSNQGRWAVHCAGNNATESIHRVSPSRLGKVFVDIGANEGVRSIV